MSNADKHITRWSTSDVQRYLRGELPEREMHQLEKAALDDPFLADAIEGLSQRAGTPLDDDLHELRTRLANRVAQKRRTRILPLWMRVAAAIVVLVGVGLTTWYALPGTRNAAQGTRNAAQGTRNAAQGPRNAAHGPHNGDVATAVPQTPAPTARTRAVLPAPTAQTKTVPPAVQYKTHTVAPAHTDAKRLHLSSSLAANTKPLPQVTPSPPSREVNRDLMDTLLRDKVALQLSGQVVDLNNRPLANASLQVSGPSNANATTNALGQFQLNLRQQDTSQRLTVSLPGYEYKSLAVNTLRADAATANTIFLRQTPQPLQEVIVDGMDQKRKAAFATAPYEDKTEKLDSFWINVTPTTGRLAYLEYLDTAKKALPVDSTIQGMEVISFAIGPKGEPADLKIERSLSPAHDAGVIRLISGGASWKVLRGKNIRAMVSVSFP